MIATLNMVYTRWPFYFWIPYSLAAFSFFTPISSSAKSIFFVLSVISIIFSPLCWPDLRQTLTKPWCQACLGLFGVLFLACMWSPATIQDKILILGKYSKLLFFPILVVGFREEKTRRITLNALIAAMVLTSLLSIFKAYGMVTYFGTLDAGAVFRNHIMTGYMMSFAAFLCALFAYQYQGKQRIAYGVLYFLLSYQILFINTGRTGYLLYLLLMGLLATQVLSWRQVLLVFLLGTSLVGIAYYENTAMQTAVRDAVADWEHYHSSENKDTSIGYRLQFHQYARALFERSPWIGNGTASFIYLYRQDTPVASWKNLFEPHSQYWLIAVEQGILGLLVFAIFLLSLFKAFHGGNASITDYKMMAYALLLSFLVGSVSESLLLYSGTGYFFLLYMAVCLGKLSDQTSIFHRDNS